MGEFKELIVEILGWENNKLLKTLKDFTIRPGESIWAFCNGNRKIYFHPMAYMFGVVGLIVLFNTYFEPAYLKEYQLFEVTEIEILDSDSGRLEERPMIHGKGSKLLEYLFFHIKVQYPNIMYVYQFLITIFHLIVFRKMNVGLKNNVWFTTYVYAHASLLVSVFTILLFFINDHKLVIIFSLMSLLMMYIYRVWASKQFYKISWGRSILKIFIIYFLLIFIPLFIGIISLLTLSL